MRSLLAYNGNIWLWPWLQSNVWLYYSNAKQTVDMRWGEGKHAFLAWMFDSSILPRVHFFFHVGFQSLNNKMRETERFKIFLPLPTILGCTQVRIIMIIKLHFLIECPAFNWPQESSRSTRCPRCATSPGEKTFFFVLLSYLMHTGVKLPFAKVRRQLPHNRDR